MKNIALLLLLFCMIFPVKAQKIYKCQVGDKTVFSDAPCGRHARQAEMKPKKGSAGTLHATPSSSPMLATSSRPVPLPAELPAALFSRVLDTCQKRDYTQLLEQFSESRRTYIRTHIPASSHHRYFSDSVCKGVSATVSGALRNQPEQYRYATRKTSGRITLCSYSDKTDPKQCNDHMDVAIEDGMLKIDEH